MANYIADETGKDVAECTFDYLTSDQLAKDFGQATFFTATDGNHGRGVAWLPTSWPEGRRAHAQGFHQAPLR